MKTAETASDLFSQAFESFDAALKTGVKIQEDSLKWWSDLVGEPRKSTEWQERMTSFVSDAMDTARKNTEESLKAYGKISRNTLEQLKKCFDGAPGGAVEEWQKSLEKLWEESLETLQKNTETVLATNEKAFKMWASFLQGAAAAKEETDSKAKATPSKGL